MKDHEILGIGFIKEKKFYYLENGQHAVSKTSIDRLRTTLIARGVIGLVDDGPRVTTTKYQVMSLEDAKINDMEIETIYISKNVELNTPKTRPKYMDDSLWD